MKKIIVLILFSVFYISHAEGQQKKYPSSCYQDLVEDGAWCWFTDPRVVQYQKKYNRVYAGSVSTKGDITVTSFDKNTGKTEHISNIGHEFRFFQKIFSNILGP